MGPFWEPNLKIGLEVHTTVSHYCEHVAVRTMEIGSGVEAGRSVQKEKGCF